MTRRSFVQIAALAAAATPRSSFASSCTPVVVETRQGRLTGEACGDVQRFLGVPFARPPLGPLRFRRPEPPATWSGSRPAKAFAPAAVQAGGGSFPQGEDCLYLNVWAPRTAGSYPVFVWIHGGGFTGGRATDPLFDGTGFAEGGAVVVTVAYRLGVLGFLDVEPLLGSGFAGSANNGVRDLLAALAWVRENIGSFGGDPLRVTIGGESAGAKLTDTLMGVPFARPLFHQMISESGGAERIATRQQAAEVGRGFGATWTAQTSLPVSALLTAAPEQLMAAQEQFTRMWPTHYPLRPAVDGDLLPQKPLHEIEAGSSRGKRLLLGTNRDESALFLGPDPEHDPTSRDLASLPLTQFLKIEAEYRDLYPAMPASLQRIRSLTAEEYLVPSVRVLQAHVEAGGEGYGYRFDLPGQGRFAGLAYHSYELRFVWNHFGGQTPSPADREMALVMHDAWLSFLQGAAPKAPTLPPWPAYTFSNEETMILDLPASHIQARPEQAELALWKDWFTD